MGWCGTAKDYQRIADEMREYYPRFSDAEYKRRYDATYALMDENGLDCLLLYGDGTLGGLHQLSAHWLSNYLDEQFSYVILPREGDPILYVSIPPDAACAMATSPIDDVRGGGVGIQMAQAVAAGLKEKASSAKRIGTIDNFAVSPGLPHAHHEAFSAALPGAEFVPTAREYERLRLVPSDEEMEWFKKGIALTDLAWEALVDAAEPGKTEADLLHVVHSSYMKEGGSYCFAILGSTPMSDPAMSYPHGITAQPALRPVAAGDMVICEMSASYYGYSGQLFCAIGLGEPPDPLQEMIDLTAQLYVDLRAAAKAGNTGADIDAVTKPVADRGLDCEAPFIHAWGTHFGHPTMGFESWTPWDVEFVDGQLLVVEPNPCSPDALLGVQLGNMTQVTKDGAIEIHEHGTEFVVK
ncbi:MAG: M24 family metallopeptidase [Solirubrobacterales bacterium]